MTVTESAPDPPSPIERLADDHLAALARLDPCAAARLSIAGSETELTDYSPSGVAARADRLRSTKSALEALTPSAADRVTADLLAERIHAQLAQHDAGDVLGVLGPINGPVAAIRGSFDNMPRETADDWGVLASRLAKVPASVESVRSGVAAATDQGRPPFLRQLEATVEQCAAWAGEPGSGGWFGGLAVARPELTESAVAAGESLRRLAEWLRREVAPRAVATDGVGEEQYVRAARMMLGSELDPREAYEWAWTEVSRLGAAMREVIDRIQPGASLVEAKEHLDRVTAIEGAEGWVAWLQELTDRTTQELRGTHFEIDEALVRCEAMLPPAGVAAAPYYSPPSEDLVVPGRTWYPTLGRERFPTWEMTTTVYHEAVPGHHLQLGRVRVLGDRLCRYRRNTIVSGHIEGWALYAERLMDELGAYEDDSPGRLGFLSFQMLRAARVVIDIGLHLGFARPDGTEWTAENARTMLVEQAALSDAFAASEVDRYLGWPAQAICYKLGEREWLAAREEARGRWGPSFDLKRWHTAALDLGSLGLAQLRTQLSSI
jgi:uncharacterized protein (DUF885 family)